MTAEFIEPRYGVRFGAAIEAVLIDMSRIIEGGEATWE